MTSKPGKKHNEDITKAVSQSTDNIDQKDIHKIIITSSNKITWRKQRLLE